MKGFLVFMMGMVAFASFGLKVIDRSPAAALALGQDSVLVDDIEEIAGTWHDFPNGLLIRFGRDGRVGLGLDADGQVIGHGGSAWFQERLLFVEFASYSGEDIDCATAVGVYQVHRLSNGGLRFVPIQDACELRIAALNGQVGVDQGPIFYPVK